MHADPLAQIFNFLGKTGSGKSLSAQRLMRIFDTVVRVIYHIGVTRQWDCDLPDYPKVKNKVIAHS